ncbi:hypothetical protein ACTJJ7_26860 [Phyllobacterium sp. 22229]|nr:hypothetical protein [Phyllobacterium myrsinacearum]
MQSGIPWPEPDQSEEMVLETAIERHRTARLEIDGLFGLLAQGDADGRPLDERLEMACAAAEAAWLAFLPYPVASLAGIRKKIAYVRSILAQGDELSTGELELLLRSIL